MFLVEEKKSLNDQCSAEIYMRDDGLFEGRIHRTDPGGVEETCVVCGVAETLPRIEAIVDEELGL